MTVKVLNNQDGMAYERARVDSTIARVSPDPALPTSVFGLEAT